MWVAEIADECIIVMDFLQAHKNLKEEILQVEGEEVALHTPQVMRQILGDLVSLFGDPNSSSG